jgi:hypothetical protein
MTIRLCGPFGLLQHRHQLPYSRRRQEPIPVELFDIGRSIDRFRKARAEIVQSHIRSYAITVRD